LPYAAKKSLDSLFQDYSLIEKVKTICYNLQAAIDANSSLRKRVIMGVKRMFSSAEIKREFFKITKSQSEIRVAKFSLSYLLIHA
jgi:hypothetical protein